jgi:hypothetical protein
MDSPINAIREYDDEVCMSLQPLKNTISTEEVNGTEVRQEVGLKLMRILSGAELPLLKGTQHES